jgi:hypothetical protein
MELIRAWETWEAVKDRPAPPTRTIWVNTYLVDYLFEQAMNSRDPMIVWTQYRAIQDALREKGLRVFGAGTHPEDEQKAITCVMSIPAHGTGKNLQLWSHSLMADFPANGAVMEQCVGRTHRPGQEADSVTVDFIIPHPSVEADIDKCLAICDYIEQSQGTKTKLNSATWI